MDESLAVADIVGVHGIKGWVKIRPRVEDPAALTRYGRVEARPGDRLRGALPRRDLEIHQVRAQGKGFIAQIKGVEDRNQAEALKGYQLVIGAAQLPPPGDGEYYWRDLIGLKVWCRDSEGQEEVYVGRVDYLLETGANDVLVIKAADGSIDDRERLVPWLPEAVVSEVNLAEGLVRVVWPLDV